MKGVLHCRWLSLVIVSYCFVALFFIPSDNGRSKDTRALSSSAALPVKAVNLGGWLVVEGWMTPWLFDNITNKDMLDGTQLKLRSVKQNMYVCAEGGGDNILVANRTGAAWWETFKLWRVNETTFYLRVAFGQFVRISTKSSELVANATNPGKSEEFVFIRSSNNRVRIRAPNGLFVQARSADAVTADYGEEGTNWGDDDPSVFEMDLNWRVEIGEYQVTNGYGPNATSVLRNHWNTFIIEDDFRTMAEYNLTAVRIPVGWWTTRDPEPPKPFVNGSLQIVDNAFNWAEKYNLRVILDLHATNGSTNGWDLSGTRDGTVDWGKTDENINQSVAAIDFLASRYTQRSCLLAIELLNEALAPDISIDSLKKYYQAGYDAVRKYSSEIYVIMSSRLRADQRELLQYIGTFKKSVIDVHYYNSLDGWFSGLSVQRNLDFINNERSRDLSSVTAENGPLVLVGEWSGEFWHSGGEASKEEYQRFAQAELNVFGRATFGWAYWSWKHEINHWSLKWMIANGYISLNKTS
ncbi:hypothetical protein LUZ62_032892 [Rhynchospora pubera]|uniref:Mannan endo-1,4-beta-mannosidase n=2 Tax=Rhynchospora pubera TaxID=906938 RepID=A0AAV8AM78_9POAL|nr:hypothetical protein LUZ62_009759 [Rhynchospora pubera]KAJ4820326.1 hypothetical protein LUZ62_032892 [Rhynchospora pubera]